MVPLEQTISEGSKQLMEKCDSLLRALDKKVILPDEFFYTLTINLIQASRANLQLSAGWHDCLTRLPREVLIAFNEWIEKNIEVKDYRPFPGPFTADQSSESLTNVQVTLRPLFLQLHRLVRQQLDISHI